MQESRFSGCGAREQFCADLSIASSRPAFAVDKIIRRTEDRINSIRKFPGAPRFMQRGLKSLADFVSLRSGKGAEASVRTDLNTLARWAYPCLCSSTARERASKLVAFLASCGFMTVRNEGGGRLALGSFEGLLAYSGSARAAEGERFISVPANLPEVAYPYLPARIQRRVLDGAGLCGADCARLKPWQRERANAWLAKRIGDNEIALLSALDKAAFDRSASLAADGIRNGAIPAGASSLPVSRAAFSASDGLDASAMSQATSRRLMIRASKAFMATLRSLTGEAASQIWASLRRLQDLGMIEVEALMCAGGGRRIGVGRILLTSAAMEIFYGIPFNVARLAAMARKLRSILPRRRPASAFQAAPQQGFTAATCGAGFSAASPGARPRP